MLCFPSASSAADLAMTHSNLKKNNVNKYVATSFTPNDTEYITAGKKSISPLDGGLKYFPTKWSMKQWNVKTSPLCSASFLSFFIPKETPIILEILIMPTCFSVQ